MVLHIRSSASAGTLPAAPLMAQSSSTGVKMSLKKYSDTVVDSSSMCSGHDCNKGKDKMRWDKVETSPVSMDKSTVSHEASPFTCLFMSTSEHSWLCSVVCWTDSSKDEVVRVVEKVSPGCLVTWLQEATVCDVEATEMEVDCSVLTLEMLDVARPGRGSLVVRWIGKNKMPVIYQSKEQTVFEINNIMYLFSTYMWFSVHFV